MSALLVGFGLGVFVAAQIGPVSLLIVRSVLRGDFWIGVAMGTAVALVDLAYAGVGLGGVARAIESAPGVTTVFGFIGAAMLAAIGLRTMWTGFRARFGLETPEEVATPARAFVTALAATALNPLTIALWTAAAPAAVAGARSGGELGVVLAGVGAGTLTWYTFFAAVVAIVRRRLGPRLLAMIDLAAGAGILAFGLLLGVRTIREA
jgi:putative LysE/RhtB family amino acid efflux pump